MFWFIVLLITHFLYAELPIGWEEFKDEEFGLYYIDHIHREIILDILLL